MIPAVKWSFDKQSKVEAVWPGTLRFPSSIQAVLPAKHLNDLFVKTLQTLGNPARVSPYVLMALMRRALHAPPPPPHGSYLPRSLSCFGVATTKSGTKHVGGACQLWIRLMGGGGDRLGESDDDDDDECDGVGNEADDRSPEDGDGYEGDDAVVVVVHADALDAPSDAPVQLCTLRELVI